jgi:DNA-binding winged helix-turn-helix (wHTH) protein
MPADLAGFVAFLALVPPWAAQGGMPPEMVLRRLCDWAMSEAFPPASFVTLSGEPANPFDIFMSGRALGSGLGVGVSLGDNVHYGDQWGANYLAGVVVSIRDVLTFCRQTDTVPPWPVQGRWRRTWTALRGRKHLAPPPCSEAEARAIAHEASDSAVASLNSLRHILLGAQGKPSPFFGRPADPTAMPDLSLWTSQWKTSRDRAQEAVTRAGTPNHQRALDDLDVHWTEFAQKENVSAVSQIGLSEMSMAEAEASKKAHSPRLHVKRSQGLVSVDGQQKRIPAQPLKLLCFLAEKAKHGSDFIPSRDIEAYLWSAVGRDPSDVIRQLRNALKGKSRDRSDHADLIKTALGIGYRLALAAADIQIDE